MKQLMEKDVKLKPEEEQYMSLFYILHASRTYDGMSGRANPILMSELKIVCPVLGFRFNYEVLNIITQMDLTYRVLDNEKKDRESDRLKSEREFSRNRG